MRGFLSFLLLAALTAVPALAVAQVLPLPTGQQSWAYLPQELPSLGLSPGEARPIGVGPVATGRALVNIRVVLPSFSGPVDIYGAYAHPSSPDHIFSLQPDLSFRPLTVDEVNTALFAGVLSPGVGPWLSTVTGPLNENPLTLSASLIPPGEYTLYLLVTPAGSLKAFYLWATRFVPPTSVVPPSNVTLSWDAPTTNSDGTPLSDLAGFKVYHGTSSRQYTASVDVGNVRSHTLSNLSPGTHYFSVTAYDVSRNESTFSNEVSKTIR